MGDGSLIPLSASWGPKGLMHSHLAFKAEPPLLYLATENRDKRGEIANKDFLCENLKAAFAYLWLG